MEFITMHVHIATIGGSPEPVTKAINAISPGIDRIHLLASDRFRSVAEDVADTCRKLQIVPSIENVSGFDFQEIVNAISRIYDEENAKGVTFSINITGGTNLMAAAACSCAFFIGATIYYVHWRPDEPMSEQLEEIPVPNVPNLSSIKGKTRDILVYILRETRAGHQVSNKSVAAEFNAQKQNSGYHLSKLAANGLILMERNPDDRRLNDISLTGQGTLIANWLMNRDERRSRTVVLPDYLAE